MFVLLQIEAETANKVPSTSRTRNPDEEQRERPEPLRMLRPAFRVPSQVQKHTEMRPLPAKMETVSVESFYGRSLTWTSFSYASPEHL